MSNSVDPAVQAFANIFNLVQDRAWQDVNDTQSEHSPISRQERHCINCEHCEGCWSTLDSDALLNRMPEGFRLRSEWEPNRFRSHIQGISAQLCGLFINDAMRHRAEEAERRRQEQEYLDKKKEEGWDL
jgi:hypothetical protein